MDARQRVIGEMRDRISALEAELAEVKAERDEARRKMNAVARAGDEWERKCAARAEQAESALASANERAAGLAAALKNIEHVAAYDDSDGDEVCERIRVKANRSISAPGFEVVKDGDKYIVTQKGAEHEAG